MQEDQKAFLVLGALAGRHPAGRSLSGIDRISGLDSSGGWLLEPIR